MVLNKYKESGLLFNSNFLEPTNDADTYGYRGELVLIEGEIADEKGHTKPPIEVVRGAVLMADEKLKMVIGALDQLESVTIFIEKYQEDFAPDITVLFFVVNIKEPMQVAIDGVDFMFIPLVQGVPWNEILDELALEKSDLKGQSSAEKIMTVYNELQSFKPKGSKLSLDEALAKTENIMRESWGAV